MKIKRYIAAIALTASFLGVVLSAALPASAATPTYNMSKQYKAEKYYKNFSAVELTGDQATDVLAIALSQLGYLEGNSDADLGGVSKGGHRDFVEFNVLFGKIDNDQGNGISYGYYWCASFVNWCLRQANVSKEATGAAEISCRRWLAACKKDNIYLGKDRTPIAGDLIFFKDAGSAVTSTHMGIVRYCDGKRVYTIEGNTASESDFSSDGNCVALKSYLLNSSYIVGYARPSYTKTDAVPKVDYSGVHTSKGLYISECAIALYKDRGLKEKLTEIESYDIFKVGKIEDDIFEISYEKDGKDFEGWAKIQGKAQQISAASGTYSVSYLDDDSQRLFVNQYGEEGDEITVHSQAPTGKDRGFLGWSKVKNSTKELIMPGEQITVDGNITLYAVWDYNFYLVSFKAPDGAIISQKYGYFGDTFEIPRDVKAPEGYVFAGWDADGIPTVITNDASYTAVFKAVEEAGSESMTEISTRQFTEESDEQNTKGLQSSGDGNKNQATLLSSLGCRSSADGGMGVILTCCLAALIFKRKKQGDPAEK